MNERRDPEQLAQSVKAEAIRCGFHLAGVCPAVSPAGASELERWLDSGYAGEMTYLERRREAYRDPNRVLDGVRSIVMLGMNYANQAARPAGAGQGRVARYAWGKADYHDVIHERLKRLAQFLEQSAPGARVRGIVDTAPLLEREFARLAGLGWQAKNTMLINKRVGSWFFLAALLTDAVLAPDSPHETSHCGTCTACLDACPTDAFPRPGVLDARRCISYLTIEHRGSIPRELRGPMGDWVFGCDVCQEVCPWNRHAPEESDSAFQPEEGMNPMDLRPLFFMDDEQFRQRFRKTPLWRPKRRGLLRNAAIVLGNRPDAGNLPALQAGVNDLEPLVRAASAWALGRHRAFGAASLLAERLKAERDPEVEQELRFALAESSS